MKRRPKIRCPYCDRLAGAANEKQAISGRQLFSCQKCGKYFRVRTFFRIAFMVKKVKE